MADAAKKTKKTLVAKKEPQPAPASIEVTKSVNSDFITASFSPDNAVVQLGAFRSEAVAHQQWLEISNRISEAHEKTPQILRVYLADKGVFYRLRLGRFGSVREAKQFCAIMVGKGVSCIVPTDSKTLPQQPEAKKHMPDIRMETETMGGPYIPLDKMDDLSRVNLEPQLR
jgi:hypothetical protein